MTNPERLIADIGGTNARFACSRADGSIHSQRVHPVADFSDFSRALDAYLATLQEEELDVELLRSMGREELGRNMASLGLTSAEVGRMADALFGAT